MDKCYNFTINATNKNINYCQDKCIKNIDINNNEIYYIINDCYCKCIYKFNKMINTNDTNDADQSVNDISISS